MPVFEIYPIKHLQTVPRQFFRSIMVLHVIFYFSFSRCHCCTSPISRLYSLRLKLKIEMTSSGSFAHIEIAIKQGSLPNICLFRVNANYFRKQLWTILGCLYTLLSKYPAFLTDECLVLWTSWEEVITRNFANIVQSTIPLFLIFLKSRKSTHCFQHVSLLFFWFPHFNCNNLIHRLFWSYSRFFNDYAIFLHYP